MKISFIGSFKNKWDEEGIALSLEGLGVEVQRIDEASARIQDIESIKKFNPDLVLFAKLKLPAGRSDFMRNLKFQTASWTFDLYWGLRRQAFIYKDPIFKADYVFSPDGGNQKKFKEAGVNHKLLRQGIYKEYCYQLNRKPEYEVIFVGSSNQQWPYRDILCDFLSKNYSFTWIGKKNTLECRGHDLNDLYAKAKVVVGDSVYSPYYWSNRLYETLGRGGFMMFPKIPGLEKEYIPYEHYIPYSMNNFTQLKEKIDYYLKESEKRKKISYMAMEYTKRFHTLDNRCQQLMNVGF